jgi:hypothetical protein
LSGPQRIPEEHIVTESPQFDAAQAQEAFKTADRRDLSLVGIGVVALIFSFFDFYKITVKAAAVAGFGGASGSATGSAWHGFFGWFGVLLMLIGAAIVAAKILGIALPFPVSLTLAVLFAVAAVCQILAFFVVPGDTASAASVGIDIDKGHGFSYWVVLILSLAGAGIAGTKHRTNS